MINIFSSRTAEKRRNWRKNAKTFPHYVFHTCYYIDVIMSAMASQTTGVSIVYSTVCRGVDQRKHHSSASLAFVRGIHRWPVNSPHTWASNAENDSIWWRHHDMFIQLSTVNATSRIFFNMSYLGQDLSVLGRHPWSRTRLRTTAICGPFYQHGLALIPALISYHMPSKVWDEITYPFLNVGV